MGSVIEIQDPFWLQWQQIIREVTLPSQYQHLHNSGRIENFLRVARGENGTHQGRYYNDSDVYKWIEAASAFGDSKEIGDTVSAIAQAQDSDGYLNTFIQLNAPEMRWRNLGAMHEMYCLGHLMEAAVAHHQGTGQRSLLEVAVRAANHVEGIFGPSKRIGYCGHPEIELGLLALSKHLGEPRYETLARWMIEQRGKPDSPFAAELEDEEAQRLSPWMKQLVGPTRCYLQDHMPVAQSKTVEGHAVRAAYLYAAAAEANGPESVASLWENLVQHRMYVTGGVGDEGAHEGFTRDDHLPNRTAYAETCASCAVAMWALRMGDFDVMERALLNGMLAGISQDGSRFFYENPLESFGGHHRQPWFDCACCPPNVARVIVGISKTLAHVTPDSLTVRLWSSFVASSEGGLVWKVSPDSITVQSGRGAATLRLWIPDWAQDFLVETPDEWGAMDFEDGFAVLRRDWEPGDQIKVTLITQPRWIAARPENLDCAGRVALQYGPRIYCAEECDLGFPPQWLSVDTEAEIEVREDGVYVEGFVDEHVPGGPYELYEPVASQAVKVRMIPYADWDNREPGAMQVWLRRSTG